uniref:Uncharacterized protein n=1 Tax=Panagrellus redivivus TaxID=6233 RepID=A0A7E4W458_PANRE
MAVTRKSQSVSRMAVGLPTKVMIKLFSVEQRHLEFEQFQIETACLRDDGAPFPTLTNVMVKPCNCTEFKLPLAILVYVCMYKNECMQSRDLAVVSDKDVGLAGLAGGRERRARKSYWNSLYITRTEAPVPGADGRTRRGGHKRPEVVVAIKNQRARQGTRKEPKGLVGGEGGRQRRAR